MFYVENEGQDQGVQHGLRHSTANVQSHIGDFSTEF